MPTHKSFCRYCHAMCGIDEHGPRSVALYAGTAVYQSSFTLPFVRAWIAGLGQVAGELPTAALADEILTPGEGQLHESPGRRCERFRPDLGHGASERHAGQRPAL